MTVYFPPLEKGGKVLRYEDGASALLGFVGLGDGGMVAETTRSVHLTAKGRVVLCAPLSKQYWLLDEASALAMLLGVEGGAADASLTDTGREWLAARRHMVEEA